MSVCSAVRTSGRLLRDASATGCPRGPGAGRLALQHTRPALHLRWVRPRIAATGAVVRPVCPAQVRNHSIQQGDVTAGECDRQGASYRSHAGRRQWGVPEYEAGKLVHYLHLHVQSQSPDDHNAYRRT